MVDISCAEVWATLRRQQFAVVGMVNQRGQARTAGVVYTTHDERVWFATWSAEWKSKHLRASPHASVTVIVPKRIPLLPWIRIPPATVTFPVTAIEHRLDSAPDPVRRRLTAGITAGNCEPGEPVVFELVPIGTFVTYGVGVPLRTMRDTDAARGRVAVGSPS